MRRSFGVAASGLLPPPGVLLPPNTGEFENGLPPAAAGGVAAAPPNVGVDGAPWSPLRSFRSFNTSPLEAARSSGGIDFSSFRSLSAGDGSKTRTHSAKADSRARSRARRPRALPIRPSPAPPRSVISRHTPALPHSAAQCSAVLQSLSASNMHTPHSSKASTRGSAPTAAARRSSGPPPLLDTTITLPGLKVETVPSLSFTVTSSLASRLRPGLPAP